MTTQEKLGPYWVKKYEYTLPTIPYRLLIFDDVGAINIDYPELGNTVGKATANLNRILEFYNGGPESGGVYGPAWGISFPDAWYKSVSINCSVPEQPPPTNPVLTFFGNNLADQTAFGVIPIGSEAVVARSNFLEKLETFRLETFEQTIEGQRPTVDNPLYLFGSTVTITQSDEAYGNIENDKTPLNQFAGRFNTTADPNTNILGDGIWWQSRGDFTITLNVPTKAFGFYGTDFGDFGGTVTIEFYNGASLIDSIVVADSGGENGSLLFSGYLRYDVGFDRIEFKIVQAVGQDNLIGIDDIIIGYPFNQTAYDGIITSSNSPTPCVTANGGTIINIPYGFTDRWSAWGHNGIGFSAYSGLNGTGTLLSSSVVYKVPSAELGPTYYYSDEAYYQTVATFVGVAKSISIGGGPFDHMEFGVPPPLPSAPILPFNWFPFNGVIATSENIDGWPDYPKYGLGFEDMLPGPDAAPGTYQPVDVTNQYIYYEPSLTLSGAVAVRSKNTGGTASFDNRTLVPLGINVVDLGKVALKLKSGSTKITITSKGQETFSMYYASASPVTITFYWVNIDYPVNYIAVLPATEVNLSDPDNKYHQWVEVSIQFDSLSWNDYLTIESADPDAMFDNITSGYSRAIDGSLIEINNTMEEYYTGGVDSHGTQGPLITPPPPYPQPYGLEFTTGFKRVYYINGPLLNDDKFYISGTIPFISNYGFMMLQAGDNGGNNFINVSGGFIEKISFFLRTGTVTIHSGLNGTGVDLTPYIFNKRAYGGYREYVFNGWARSIKFSNGAIVDALRIGPHTDINVPLPYFPWVNSYTSEEVDWGNESCDEQYISYSPTGMIQTSNRISTAPNHWIRDVNDPYLLNPSGSVIHFSFDGAVNGQSEFENTGKLGGSWPTRSSNIQAVTGISKFGTSSLHVSPGDNSAFEIFWPEFLTINNYSTNQIYTPGGMTYPVGNTGTLETFLRPERGTSVPFNKTVIMFWGFGNYKSGNEWRQNNYDVYDTAHLAATVYGYNDPNNANNVILEAFLGSTSAGRISVLAGEFHHVAITVQITDDNPNNNFEHLSGNGNLKFYVNEIRVGESSYFTANYDYYYSHESRTDQVVGTIVIGMSDKYGTFNYYLSETRFSRNQLVYTTPTYIVPTTPFTSEVPIDFPGKNYWIKFTLESSSYHENNLIDVNNVDFYNGDPFDQWLRLDIPRKLRTAGARTFKFEYKGSLSTDSNGNNLIAIPHERSEAIGSRSLDDSFGWTGNSTIVAVANTYINAGNILFYHGTNSDEGIRNPSEASTRRYRNLITDDFEWCEVGQVSPLNLYFETADSQLVCTITGDFEITDLPTSTTANISTNGKNYLIATGELEFNFSQPITLFGCTISGSFTNNRLKMIITDVNGGTRVILSTTNSTTPVWWGFSDVGKQVSTVKILPTDATLPISFGIDLLTIGCINQSNVLMLRFADYFNSTGLLRDCRPTNGSSWISMFNDALSNISITSNNNFAPSPPLPEFENTMTGYATAQPTNIKYGATLNKAVKNCAALVTLRMEEVEGTTFGIIACKNQNGAYYYLEVVMKVDYYFPPIWQKQTGYNVTLYYHPAVGPDEIIIPTYFTPKGYLYNFYYEIVNGVHLFSLETASRTYEDTTLYKIAYPYPNSVYDDRLSDGEWGFTMKSPTSSNNIKVSSFKLYEFPTFTTTGYETYEPYTVQFGETLGPTSVIGGATLSSLQSFYLMLRTYARYNLTLELGQTAPFFATRDLGPGNLVVDVTGTNVTVVSSSANKYNTSGVTPAFITVDGLSITFTPRYTSNTIVYRGIDSSGGILPTNGNAVTQKNLFLEALNDYFLVSSPISNISFNNSYKAGYGSTVNTATITGGSSTTTNQDGQFATSSATYWRSSSGTPTNIQFLYGISGFGCYITDLTDIEGPLTAYLTPDDGSPEEVILVNSDVLGSGSVMFFGFISYTKQYKAVRFEATGTLDSYGIDDIYAVDGTSIKYVESIKAFGVTMTDAAKIDGTVYTATVNRSIGSPISVPIPLTNEQPSSGSSFWGVTLNSPGVITSVTITSNNQADMPGFDDIIFGTPNFS